MNELSELKATPYLLHLYIESSQYMQIGLDIKLNSSKHTEKVSFPE